MLQTLEALSNEIPKPGTIFSGTVPATVSFHAKGTLEPQPIDFEESIKVACSKDPKAWCMTRDEPEGHGFNLEAAIVEHLKALICEGKI